MQQQISLITLGVAELARSRRFYVEGFGWQPVFENEDIIFYQMNGLVFSTFLHASLETDMNRGGLTGPAPFALAHNVQSQAEVNAVMDRLRDAGGEIIREADAPPHGGYRGYVTDPDDHAWEIAWNPGFVIDERGFVTFGL